MKIPRLLGVSVLAASLLLGACVNRENTTENQANTTKQENAAHQDQHMDDKFVKNNVYVGADQGQVKKVYGDSYAAVISALNDKDMWRYDFPVESGYTFDSSVDEVDLEGIQNGQMKMQLFVEWTDDDKVESYSLYYKRENGEVYHYQLHSDGGETDEPIQDEDRF